MAKITGHPIADFLALFSILISSPLIAGLSSPDYYIVRKPSSLEKDIFSIPILFSICVIVLYVLNLQQGFYYILLVMLASRSADEALMKMTLTRIGKVFVCDPQGVLLGLVSKTDIMNMLRDKNFNKCSRSLPQMILRLCKLNASKR